MPVVDGLTQSHTIIMVDHRDSEEYTLRHEEYSVQHGTVLSAWPRLSRQMLHRAGCKQNHGADVDSLGRCVTVATSRSTPCSKPTTDSQHIQRDVSTTSAVVVCVCGTHSATCKCARDRHVLQQQRRRSTYMCLTGNGRL